MKKLIITLLALLSLLVYLPVIAETEEKTDDVSVSVTEVDGVLNVQLKGDIFKELDPTIKVLIDIDEDIVLIDPDGNKVNFTYEDGVLSFKASQAGSFAIKEKSTVDSGSSSSNNSGYTTVKTCVD